MTTLRVTDHNILRAFNAVMSMDKTSTNIRRAKAEVAACEVVGKLIKDDNQHHMYDKRIHRNAGEFKLKGTTAVIEKEDGDIRGPVTINIVNTPKRTRKAVAA